MANDVPLPDPAPEPPVPARHKERKGVVMGRVGLALGVGATIFFVINRFQAPYEDEAVFIFWASVGLALVGLVVNWLCPPVHGHSSRTVGLTISLRGVGLTLSLAVLFLSPGCHSVESYVHSFATRNQAQEKLSKLATAM